MAETQAAKPLEREVRKVVGRQLSQLDIWQRLAALNDLVRQLAPAGVVADDDFVRKVVGRSKRYPSSGRAA